MEKKRQVWSVRQLILRLSDLIDQTPRFKNVWVEGEISNFTHHSSGHMYFTLKDESSKIRCVMFSRYNRLVLFHPQNGDRVLIRGELEMYERDGLIQLKALEMRKSGMGDLYQRFLQLKEKLEQEGLFAKEKRSLPKHPRTIGVITSAHGAAVRDIITTIRRRCPYVHILLFPVAVQGISAVREIAYGIEQMNERDDLDLLIVGRGGGSLEELWAFNEEIVVRAIANSKLPIISAVGHETDTTLSDYAADVRAATPTAAAELAVPDRRDLQKRLSQLSIRLQRGIEMLVSKQRKHLHFLWERPVFQKASARFEPFHQRLDYLIDRLRHQEFVRRKDYSYLVERLEERLHRQHPALSVKQANEIQSTLEQRLMRAIEKRMVMSQDKLSYLVAHLDALSPLKVMQRGYSLVYRFPETELVQSVEKVQPGDLLRVELNDGWLKCQIWGVKKKNERKQ